MKVWLVLCFLCTQAYLGLTQNEKEDIIRTIFGLTDPLEVCGPNQKCVPRAECPKSALVAGGEHIIDIRFGSDNCGHDNFVCCNTNDMVPPACGIRNKEGVGSEINGGPFEAKFGEFPWMVAVLLEESFENGGLPHFHCGGSLVARNAVLTATHCVRNLDPRRFVVRAGEWNIKSQNESIPHQDRKVKEVIIHEKSEWKDGYKNVALLIVDEPFEYKETVRPICLRNRNQYFDFERCYVTGWGKEKCEAHGTYPDIMKKLEMSIVSRQVCQKILKEKDFQTDFLEDRGLICSQGVGEQKTCRGDGGGPLICLIDEKSDRYVQVGILVMQWRMFIDAPIMLTDVALLREWIDGKLISRNIDVSECSL